MLLIPVVDRTLRSFRVYYIFHMICSKNHPLMWKMITGRLLRTKIINKLAKTRSNSRQQAFIGKDKWRLRVLTRRRITRIK